MSFLLKALLFAGICYIAYAVFMRMLKPSNPMPRDEAAKLLGIDPAASTDAVLDAHRRLIAKVHPDAGGNAELAARINEARDTMLKP